MSVIAKLQEWSKKWADKADKTHEKVEGYDERIQAEKAYREALKIQRKK